jgi:hypothetical protein
MTKSMPSERLRDTRYHGRAFDHCFAHQYSARQAIAIEIVFRCQGHWHFPADGGALIGNAMTESISAMRKSGAGRMITKCDPVAIAISDDRMDVIRIASLSDGLI